MGGALPAGKRARLRSSGDGGRESKAELRQAQSRRADQCALRIESVAEFAPSGEPTA
jgi:hypothetical protein